ncbi:MAG TPA: metallopeptidase family protein [Candidatus Bipolaricaulota bacterium]
MVSQATFERWVGEAIGSLPAFFTERIQNVAFVVEDVPSPEVLEEHPQDLLGLYQGVPLPERSVWQDLPPMPDVITLYQKNIESICRNQAEVKRQIALTVMHELGHYFGLSEEEMDAVETRWAEDEPA